MKLYKIWDYVCKDLENNIAVQIATEYTEQFEYVNGSITHKKKWRMHTKNSGKTELLDTFTKDNITFFRLETIIQCVYGVAISRFSDMVDKSERFK